MSILLDSSVIIDLMRGKIKLKPTERYYINPIVYSEVLYGLLYASKSEKELEGFFDELGIETLIIGTNTAIVHSKMKLDLNRRGQPLPDNDLLVAATCLEHNLQLFTLNLKHFSRIRDLNLVDEV